MYDLGMSKMSSPGGRRGGGSSEGAVEFVLYDIHLIFLSVRNIYIYLDK